MSEIGPKDPRMFDEKYLAFVRTLPCCVCERAAPSDAAHVKMDGRNWGYPQHRAFGGAERPHDRRAVPLCKPILGTSEIGCHGKQHGMNEEAFWQMVGKNPFEIAEKLYALGGGTERPKKQREIKPRAKVRQKIKGRNAWPPKGSRRFGQ
jgi:hypothetical protein